MIKQTLMAAALSAGFTLSATAQEVEHFTTIEDAVKAAAKGNRDIIVDFTGSDWCGWCIKLVEEVFSQEEWKKNASGKYVFVEIDFPRNKKLKDEEKKYNETLQKKYGVRGYPSIYILDSKGIPYAKTGYQAGGPEGYLKHLAELAGQKEQIVKLRAEADARKDKAPRVEALVALVDKADEFQVGFAYSDLKEEIVKLDEKNTSGRRPQYLRELALAAHEKGQADKLAAFLKLLQESDKAAADEVEATVKVAKEVQPHLEKQAWDKALEALAPLLTAYPAGKAGQIVLYSAGVCNFRLSNKEKGLELLQKALELAPDSEMAPKIKKTIAQARKMG